MLLLATAAVVVPGSGAVGDGGADSAEEVAIVRALAKERGTEPSPEGLDDAVIPPAQAPFPTVRARSSRRAPDTRKASGPRKVRVLFVYSPQARKAAGGRAKVRSLAQRVIQQTNTVFANSKTGVRVVLAGVKRTSNEKRRNTGGNLRSLWKRDGRFDAVPRWRARKNADLVHLLVKTTERGYCGRGYLRPRARYAYSTAAVRCATRYRSSAHEIAHNFGADHDARAGYRPSSRLPARGKVNIAKKWYTLMSYPTACTEADVYCRQLPYLSNPYLRWKGDRLGTKGKSNNAGVVRQRAGAVARFE